MCMYQRPDEQPPSRPARKETARIHADPNTLAGRVDAPMWPYYIIEWGGGLCGLRPRMLGEGEPADGFLAFVNEGPFPDTSEMLSTLRFASHEYVAVLLRSRRLAPGFFGAVRGPIGSVYARSTGAHQSRTTRGPCRALCVRRRDRLSNLLPLAPFSSPAGRMHTTNQRAPRRAVSQLRR